MKLGQGKQKIRGQEARIDFSFKREMFFIVVGGFVGALFMAIPMTFSGKVLRIRYLDSIRTYSWCKSPPRVHYYRWSNDSYNNWDFNRHSVRNISL